MSLASQSISTQKELDDVLNAVLLIAGDVLAKKTISQDLTDALTAALSIFGEAAQVPVEVKTAAGANSIAVFASKLSALLLGLQ